VSILRFGIPSLDSLIDNGRKPPAAEAGESVQSTSLSIIGPDGTGKSILGLYLAAHYLFDHRSDKQPPLVLYVSTDLSYSMAYRRTWVPFALNYPGKRIVPFDDAGLAHARGDGEAKIGLTKLRPLSEDSTAEADVTVSAFINGKRSQAGILEVGFVDLAANTAGDDWGFINRMLALLPSPGKGGTPHLMLLDAVEGFETLVGDLDAYGQISSRRSRIAQIMRSAHDKCHLVFIAEEPSEERRIPEQFVTDVVLRLRKRIAGDYIRRTLEVEKARGLEHVRGMHPYVIRSGRGSTTGDKVNLDDPAVPAVAPQDPEPAAPSGKPAKEENFQSYFHVFSSLHQYARSVMQRAGEKRPHRPNDKFAGFGIPYLDSMLAGHVDKEQKFEGGFEIMGLPCASVTALIGDALTKKTGLGRAFLGRCFAQYPARLIAVADARPAGEHKIREYLESLKPGPGSIDSAIEILRPALGPGSKRGKQWLKRVAEALAVSGANASDGFAILFTTRDVDAHTVVAEFIRPLLRAFIGSKSNPILEKVVSDHCVDRTICRRLEVHDLPSPILMHVVQRAIWEAQSRICKPEIAPADVNQRFERSHRIRVVIEDFSAVLGTYPEVRNDPLFLPSLLFHLRREGVTSLIVDTHSGQPGMLHSDAAESELRALVDQRLYTWHVPFYGENRVAIAPIPPLTIAAVRELKRRPAPEAKEPDRGRTADEEELEVSPEFEMYTGLEERRPQPVPLEIHVHEETPAFRAYIEKENLFYRSLFAPATHRTGTARDIMISRSGADYESLQDFCYLDNHVRLDHTLVFEVDEFWAIRPANALADVSSYLHERTTANRSRSSGGDPFGLFQPSLAPSEEKIESRARYECFPRYFSTEDQRPKVTPSEDRIDRVPFSWDFGFLVCRKRAWDLASVGRSEVEEVWSNLRRVSDKKDERDRPRNRIGWPQFLHACREVARVESIRTNTPIPAFDLSLLSPESIASLVLEIWASEIDEIESGANLEPNERNWTGGRTDAGLLEWLDEAGNFDEQYRAWKDGADIHFKGHWLALYKTWLVLGETLDLAHLIDPSNAYEFMRREPDPSAVATRQWYKTAANPATTFSPSDPPVAAQLPGKYSVRGDWFLAVSRNSRSLQLAHRAIDVLSTRRANFNRMQMGVGLPARDIRPMEVGVSLYEPNPSEVYAGTRTCMFKPGADGERHSVSYADLLYIGADMQASTLNWLWRSRLNNYDRHTRIFQQWLSRMMVLMNQLKVSEGRGWVDSFEVVRQLNSFGQKDGKKRKEFLQKRPLNSMDEFQKRVGYLVMDLKQASPRD